jgi:flagellar assembly protein FliH
MAKNPPPRQVPPPQGSRGAAAYTRFIPREELGSFASWQPGAIGDAGEQLMPERRAHPRPSAAGGSTGATAAAASNGFAGPQAAEPTAEDWQAEVAAARQAGYQDGYRDGLVALESFKQSFASQATAQIGALLQAFDEQTQALDAELAAAVTRTALALARQVLRAELATQPACVARVAAEAVGTLVLGARHITVAVHPLDLPLVAEGAEDMLRSRGARLQADPAVSRGGVRIESEVGTIDARIETRWAQAAASFDSDLPWPVDDGPAAPVVQARAATPTSRAEPAVLASPAGSAASADPAADAA